MATAQRELICGGGCPINKKGPQAGQAEGLLESAPNAPFQTFAEADLYLPFQQKAARLCYSLVKNYPFVDGNKRSGAHAMLVFLEVNGIELWYTQQELSDVIL